MGPKSKVPKVKFNSRSPLGGPIRDNMVQRGKWFGLMLRDERGASIIEVLVGFFIITLLTFGMLTFFENENRSANTIEFHSQREQLRLAIISQFLKTPLNCKCLFQGATTINSGGSSKLAGFTPPAAIGPFEGTDCSIGIKTPIINRLGMGGVRMSDVNIHNIVKTGDNYVGRFEVKLESTKLMSGASSTILRIPVLLSSTSASTFQFNECMNIGNQEKAPPPYKMVGFNVVCRGGLTCDQQATILCRSLYPDGKYCLWDFDSSLVDGGTRNAGTKSYMCSTGFCVNGTNKNITLPTLTE